MPGLGASLSAHMLLFRYRGSLFPQPLAIRHRLVGGLGFGGVHNACLGPEKRLLILDRE